MDRVGRNWTAGQRVSSPLTEPRARPPVLGQAAILIPRVVCNFASKPRRQGKCLPLATQLNLGNDQSGVVADMGYAPQSAQRFLGLVIHRRCRSRYASLISARILASAVAPVSLSQEASFWQRTYPALSVEQASKVIDVS